MEKEKLGDFTFLGNHFHQEPDGSVFIDQVDYIQGIKANYIPAARRRTPTAKATDEERTKFKSLTQQLAWPARSTMPELCFSVSDLQQRAEELDVAGMVKANTTLRLAKQRVEAGHGIFYPAGPADWSPKDLCVLGVHDASFAQQPGGASQQGYMVFVTHKNTVSARSGPVWAVDWGSHKIHRVIRSTLAAEAASASHTYDKLTYIRTIMAEIFYGWNSDWDKLSRRVDAAMVTDCKSLKDLTDKVGSLPSEKRIALDIADVRQGIEAGDRLLWTSTDKMAADSLTKLMSEDMFLTRVLRKGYYDFTPTPKKPRKSEDAK